MTISVSREGTTYTATREGEVVWTLELPIEAYYPFFAELHWPAAKVVAIGGGQVVHFVDAASGRIVETLSLESRGDWFGYFGELDEDPQTLYILGWERIHALAPDLAYRWMSDRLAVDGIIWRKLDGDRLYVSCEMDPPGGWEDVVVDRTTGREIARGVTT